MHFQHVVFPLPTEFHSTPHHHDVLVDGLLHRLRLHEAAELEGHVAAPLFDRVLALLHIGEDHAQLLRLREHPHELSGVNGVGLVNLIQRRVLEAICGRDLELDDAIAVGHARLEALLHLLDIRPV